MFLTVDTLQSCIEAKSPCHGDDPKWALWRKTPAVGNANKPVGMLSESYRSNAWEAL